MVMATVASVFERDPLHAVTATVASFFESDLHKYGNGSCDSLCDTQWRLSLQYTPVTAAVVTLFAILDGGGDSCDSLSYTLHDGGGCGDDCFDISRWRLLRLCFAIRYVIQELVPWY